MKLKNTSNIKKDILREIIAFVKPTDITNFDIWFKKSTTSYFGGRSYPLGCAIGHHFSPYVVCRIPLKSSFPYRFNPQKKVGYLKHIIVYNIIEGIVYLTAHELRHLWQKKHPKGYRYYKSKGQYSERDADCYALHKLREWRRKLVYNIGNKT